MHNDGSQPVAPAAAENTTHLTRRLRVRAAITDRWPVLNGLPFCAPVWMLVLLMLWSIPQSRNALSACFENVFAGPGGWRDLVSLGVLALLAALVFFWILETLYWAGFVARLPAHPARTPVRPGGDETERLDNPVPTRVAVLASTSVWFVLLGTFLLVTAAPALPLPGALAPMPSSAVMAAAAASVLVGTVLLAIAGALPRLPITIAVVVFAVTSGVIGRLAHDPMRASPRSAGTATGFAGSVLPVALAERRAGVPYLSHRAEPAPSVAAAAGGTSRAALWTAILLARLERGGPGLYKYRLAIGCDPGGSPGVVDDPAPTIGLAFAENPPARAAGVCPRAGRAASTGRFDCSPGAIAYHHPDPSVTGNYPDLVKRLLPGTLVPGRAAASASWKEAGHTLTAKSATGLGQLFFLVT
jgi:hypothetical protein